MLQHGGYLLRAAEQYKIPLDQWIDLSTGINPETCPFPTVPQSVYNRLPEDNDELNAVAKQYYQAETLLAIPGSQSVIQLLPQLRSKCRVALPVMGYAEHAHAWQQAGHQVDALSTEQINENIRQYDVVVVINPNNPSGETYRANQLLNWHQQLEKKGGWLIVDEAFIDCRAEQSLASKACIPGLIVLRSTGKFFGLAGIRSGFVIAHSELLQTIENALGPWAVTGPSRYITIHVLQNESWQLNNRKKLKQQTEKLKQLLERFFLHNNQCQYLKGTDLFQTLFCENATELHKMLANQGVLTRLLDTKQGVRFGLPQESQWKKLESMINNVFIQFR